MILNLSTWRRRIRTQLRDQLLQALSRDLKMVRFVQIGANDGVGHDPLHQHVTRYRWSGVLVEPLPQKFEELQRNYAGSAGLQFAQLAVSNRASTQTLYYFEPEDGTDVESLPEWYDKLASFDRGHLERHIERTPRLNQAKIREITVRSTRLQNLMEEYGVPCIDVLQLDTEGHDVTILNDIDFNEVRPLLIGFEHKHASHEDKRDLFLRMRSYGYDHASVGCDSYFFRHDASIRQHWRTRIVWFLLAFSRRIPSRQ